MNTQLFVTTIVTIFLAFAGYLFTYINNRRLSQRQEQLQRVNRQLSELYGPLFALSEASNQVFEEFKQRYSRPGGASFFEDSTPPTETDLKEWRLWVTTIFMPKNRRLYDLITSKADLLIEDFMPPSLLQFCAHVTGYELTLKRWEQGDFSEHLSIIPYPGPTLLNYARQSFDYLKHRQAQLLGHREVRPG